MYRKYKGCVGGIREIDCLQNKPYFGTVSLDRFLRVYNLNKQTPIQKMYLKSQLNCILLTKGWNHRGVYVLSRSEKLQKPVKRKLSTKAHRRMRMDYHRFEIKNENLQSS